jgi:gliding motility-associated-like protein
LHTKDIEITAAPGLTITYHLTPSDALTGSNPIPNGPYCNIANPQTIYPRVYNPAAPACVSTTSFQLIVNPKPQVNLLVSDYQLCDNNNSPDGKEEFNLPTKDAEIINGQPSMVVTYYFDQPNAIAQTNALPNLYTNVVANVQTIWFNIKNTVTGCTSVGSFKLVVNPLPLMTVNNPTVCQGNPATVFATAATAANYSYVWTVPSGASNPGNVPSFTTTTPGVYSVVATNTVTGCVGASASGTATFITAPSYSVPTLYELCDDNNDGVSCAFVLNTKDTEISTQAGIVITYHLTPTDAQTGANPIPKNTPYCNITNPQTIYPRIFNPAAPTCASTTSFQLMVNPKPSATLPSAYHICDDNTDGIQVFNLSGVVTPQVLGTTLPAANYTVTYYTSLANAQAGAPVINPASAFVSASTTIWIRVQNNATGCYSILTMSLVVDSLPQLPSPNFFPQYELCETVAPVCIETFDLTTKIPSILQGQLGMQVLFYPSLAEAISNTNVIANPSAYDNAIPCAQTLGIRITNSITGCYVISTMDLVVNPKPQPIPPTGPYTVCGTDQSGLSCVDLTTNLTPNILFQSPGVYTISYHLTAADATNNLNAVNASWYCMINAFSQFLWVRAENPNTHCFEVMQIELNVDPAPIMPPNLTAIANCDTDSNTQDGCTTFNLETQTPIILAVQVTPATNYTVSYYTTQASASVTPAGLSIFNTTSYTACGTTTIWVRVENKTTHCFSVGSFQLQVNTPIVLTTPTLYSLCDYAQPTSPANDQYAIFDMLGFVGAVPGHTLEFYLDANHTQLISNPSAYQNSTNAAQTVFIVATNNTTGCKSYRTLTIQVLPIPTPRTDLTSLPLVKCDDVNPNDGYEIFDLTVNANYIMNGDVNVTLHYFPSYTDAVNNTSEILTPTAANVHQNVWIRVESMYNIDTQSPPQHCYVLVEQPIKVNPLPLIVPGVVYQECDDDTDGHTVFHLNSQASILLNGNALPLTNYTLAFYLDTALTQPIPSTFTNTNTTGNTQIIYVVATNTVTGCKSPVSQFTIMVNPKPILNIPPDYATCDDEANDNDGYYLYPLDVLIPGILGATQTLADYDVMFYDTQYNPQATPPLLPTAITNLTNYQAYTHTVWVVVKNKVTGCERIATFNIIVEQKPQPKIEAITNVICVDYNTHQVVRDLVLTATNTTPYLNTIPTYTYQWYDAAGVAIPGATGATYTVSSPFADNTSTNFTVSMTSTSPQGCTDGSAPFTVLQSGQAVPLPSGSQGYTITNAFSANQTITVNITGYGNYQYSLDDGPRQDSNVFENVGLGEHYVTVWDTTAGIAYSCDPLVISQIATIDYPHYFTPNGDGIHDNWNIHGLENDFTAKIYIFDRYGKLIKQISPQGQGWDGTYNGIALPSTDYWFTVDYTEAAAYKQFKAHFSLKR